MDFKNLRVFITAHTYTIPSWKNPPINIHVKVPLLDYTISSKSSVNSDQVFMSEIYWLLRCESRSRHYVRLKVQNLLPRGLVT